MVRNHKGKPDGLLVSRGLRSSPARARNMLCAAREGPGLIRQDVEQSAGDGSEVVGLGTERLEAREQQAEGIVERVIHHPHAGCGSGQGGKALRLLFKIEQGGLVEGRSSGQITCGDRGVQQREQLLVVLSCNPLVGNFPHPILSL